MSNLIDKTVLNKIGVPMMTKYLDLASLRHKLIAGNIANISTPNYQGKDINFHAELKKAVSKTEHLAGVTTHERHIPLGRSSGRDPKVFDKEGAHNGLNRVDIDREVADMTQNQIYFSIGAKLLQNKFDGLRRAIRSK